MPPPVSFIDITSVPFSQLVTQAMFNVANEQWFRYIASSPIALGIQTNAGGTFIPRSTIYESDGTTVIRAGVNGIFGQWTPLTSAGTYYIKIVRSVGGASNFDFTFTANTANLDIVSLTAGDIIVNDDQDLPAILVDNAGVLKSYISTVPGGEIGAILPSNISIWHDFYGKYSITNRIAVLDANLNYITSVNCNLIGLNKPKLGVDLANNLFYVVNQWDELWTISESGVAVNTGYFFPIDSPQVIGINPAGTILYWAAKNADGIIHRLQLSDFSDLSDLYTISGFDTGTDKIATTPNNHPGDLLILPNGDVVTWWYDASVLSYKLIHLNSAGILQNTYTYADPIQLDHLAYINADSTHVLIWLYTTSGLDTGHFGRLTLATGVIDQDFTQDLFEEGVNMLGTAKFGISTSCTFLSIQDAPAPTPSGTIQIVKVTVPSGLSQEFNFIAGGGLSPTSFNLIDGQTQTFLSVPVGSGYSIEEIDNPLYNTEYTVSNDSLINNIEVAEDEIVVITVTNTQLSSIGSGIYKIVPGKRNDTLWSADMMGTTDVKIPNTFIKTGLVGD